MGGLARVTWAGDLCQRPYHVEHTSSRPITEVKQRWAGLVLGWVTAWEPPVPLAPSSFPLSATTEKANKLFHMYHSTTVLVIDLEIKTCPLPPRRVGYVRSLHDDAMAPFPRG